MNQYKTLIMEFSLSCNLILITITDSAVPGLIYTHKIEFVRTSIPEGTESLRINSFPCLKASTACRILGGIPPTFTHKIVLYLKVVYTKLLNYVILRLPGFYLL